MAPELRRPAKNFGDHDGVVVLGVAGRVDDGQRSGARA